MENFNRIINLYPYYYLYDEILYKQTILYFI